MATVGHVGLEINEMKERKNGGCKAKLGSKAVTGYWRERTMVTNVIYL
jgi:hypothetical protein